MKRKSEVSNNVLRSVLAVSVATNIVLVAGVAVASLAARTESPVDRFNRAHQEYTDLCAQPDVLDRVVSAGGNQGRVMSDAQRRAWIGYNCGERAGGPDAYAADLADEFRQRNLPPLSE